MGRPAESPLHGLPSQARPPTAAALTPPHRPLSTPCIIPRLRLVDGLLSTSATGPTLHEPLFLGLQHQQHQQPHHHQDQQDPAGTLTLASPLLDRQLASERGMLVARETALERRMQLLRFAATEWGRVRAIMTGESWLMGAWQRRYRNCVRCQGVTETLVKGHAAREGVGCVVGGSPKAHSGGASLSVFPCRIGQDRQERGKGVRGGGARGSGVRVSRRVGDDELQGAAGVRAPHVTTRRETTAPFHPTSA